jgi:hypothetical protein
LVAVRRLASGFSLVEFTSPGSVQESLRFAITALQSAGYTVGRGQDSPGESHLPFTRDGRPGVVVLVAVNACNTKWQIEA